MELVETSMEAFVVFVLMKKKVQIAVEHDDEVDVVQKQAEVVNELMEEQNYYYSLTEP